ncbi:hypothetical protein DUNSADRAFT_12478 [Dunaliella salina]|uniref:Uncharacterized protein n=1 Tax=Dunaliella salina TaxID=3046 RepID=A0ABQ7H3X5_DUNSA|nr:hypothetical protein DUNSADRAFT_12478 [Dunaliella salina]|eukprot:KAF5841550.1 hypothetical protein DUNSADRAFT_12478 [Dunaliella salina]
MHTQVKPFCDPTNSLSTPDNIEELKLSETPISLEQAVSTHLEIQEASKPQVPHATAPDTSWDTSLLGAIPFSVAVVSSDTSEVLHCRFGSEPGACKLLSQTLQQSSLSSTPFLTALLGPEVEAAALRTVRGGRLCDASGQQSLGRQTLSRGGICWMSIGVFCGLLKTKTKKERDWTSFLIS